MEKDGISKRKTGYKQWLKSWFVGEGGGFIIHPLFLILAVFFVWH